MYIRTSFTLHIRSLNTNTKSIYRRVQAQYFTMSESKFEIPAEFASQLRHVPSKDTRTDAEIIATLNDHAPITSEKNIWTYW